MILFKATIENYESVIAFYNDVMERIPDIERFARWQEGKNATNGEIRLSHFVGMRRLERPTPTSRT